MIVRIVQYSDRAFRYFSEVVSQIVSFTPRFSEVFAVALRLGEPFQRFLSEKPFKTAR
jgi:hypothetical protein